MTRVKFGSLIPSTVGFDHFFDAIESLETTTQTYPPHNVVKIDDNNYLVELAVSGFSQDEIDIQIVKDQLVIKGAKLTDDNRMFLHRGIGTRAFTKSVYLAKTVQVNGASLENGILSIRLENVVPEEDLPRKIPITSKSTTKVLEASVAEKQLLQE